MRVTIVLVCHFVFALTCFAQQYPVVHYTPKDGLVNSRIRKVYQDSRGLLYFMTYSGLSVYDGTRFQNFTTHEGLTNDLVNDVIEITPDSLLITTNACGLNALVQGKLIKLQFGDKPCPIVNEIIRTPAGRVFTTADDGLYELTSRGFEKFSTSSYQPSLQLNYLGNMVVSGKHLVTSCNEMRSFHGLFLFDLETKELIDAIPDLAYQIKQGAGNQVWVNNNGELKNLDSIALSAGKLKLRSPYKQLLIPNKSRVHDIDFESGGHIVLLTADGILREGSQGVMEKITAPGLQDLLIMDQMIDRENTIWISSDGNGAYKICQSNFRYDVPFSTSYPQSIRVVSTGNPNAIAAITNDAKLILKTKDGDQLFTFQPSAVINAFLISGNSIYMAESNELYYGEINHQAKQIKLQTTHSLPDTNSYGGRMITDAFGHTIVTDKMQMHFFNGGKLVYSVPYSQADLVEAMFFTEENLLWVINRWTGISLYTLDPGYPEKYAVLEFSHIKALEGASPRCAVIDSAGIFWIGTRSHGLLGFEQDGGILTRRYSFNLKDGLTDQFITTLFVGDDQSIYAGTQTGLDRLVKTANGYRIENLTKRHNIFSYILHIWAGYDGKVYAITNAGRIVEIEKGSRENTTHTPSLLIRELKVNDELITLEKSLRPFNYSARNITLRVAAPSYLDESQVVYRYRLPGKQWSQPVRGGEINLFNLSPGSYNLFLKAQFPGTTYPDQETSLSFQILPAWWQRMWFRIAVLIAVAFSLFILVRAYYRRKLERQKLIAEKQQAIEKERTRIATDMHDDLGSGLSRIRFLGENISWKNQHGQPIEQDVAKIRSYSHEMIDKMGEIVWALNEKNDSLEDLLFYIRAYAVEYLTQHDISCKVDINESVPALFVSGETRRNVFLTVKEALHNVVKHAKASAVTMTMKFRPELEINIKDNGIGFSDADIRPFSNGISNMQHRIAEIGGRLKIENQDGTQIQINIPIPHN